jgi:hypothetical protein
MQNGNVKKEDRAKSGENRRRYQRKYPLFKIPAYDADTRKFLGLIQDINEHGVQLLGVEVEVNTSKHIVVQTAGFISTPPLHFVGLCRWCRRETPQGYFATGFEITSIDEMNKATLARLTKFVTLG